MPKTTSQLRALWGEFQCAVAGMVTISFGPDRIRVAPSTVEAWEALAAVMLHHGYNIRTQDTDSYNCRQITGGTGPSLHSFGIALDVNWSTNPYRDHDGVRVVHFSDKPTQDERASDVRRGIADTDMTPAMIADIEAIKTRDGIQVFEWGGRWSDRKDCMHFELDVSPDELARGIDPDSVRRGAGSAIAAGPAQPSNDFKRVAVYTSAINPIFGRICCAVESADRPGDLFAISCRHVFTAVEEFDKPFVDGLVSI